MNPFKKTAENSCIYGEIPYKHGGLQFVFLLVPSFTTVIWTYSSSPYEVIKKIKHQGKRKRKIFPVEKENNSIPKKNYLYAITSELSPWIFFWFFLLVFLPLIFLFQQASLNHVQKMKISIITKLPFPSDKAGKKTYTTRHPEG